MQGLQAKIGVKSSFLDQVGLELKRAERYRLFVSLIVLDLSFIGDFVQERAQEVLKDVARFVQQNIRVIDNVSLVAGQRLALLLPETSRQGAEIAARRLSKLIQDAMAERLRDQGDRGIPLEMASYPDAAGAKTVTEFLKELSGQSQN